MEADLAERLNMSRTPVRGAIHWLHREGYVLEHRNFSKSRMIVAPLTKEDANELYLIIGNLEGIAGRGVAGCKANGDLRPAEKAERTPVADMRRLRVKAGGDIRSRSEPPPADCP